jgi:hypothetical protein
MARSIPRYPLLWRAAVCAGARAETVRPLARGGHNDLDNFGAIEIARNFINLRKG